MYKPPSPNTEIVAVLKKYGSVHIEFLAKLLSRRPPEITEQLDTLEREGVIKRDGEMVGIK